jgi:hypothetical protein
MATNFLLPHTEARSLPGRGKPWDRAASSSRSRKTGVLCATAATIVVAALLVGNPFAFLMDAAVSLVGTSSRNGAGRPTSMTQSTAAAQAFPENPGQAPKGANIAAAFEVFSQGKTEIPETAPEALLKQFQAWATEEGGRVQVQQPQAPVEPAQDIRAEVKPGQTAQAEDRPMKKQRPAGLERNSKAQRAARRTQPPIRQERNAAQAQPEQKEQTPDRALQNSQISWPDRKFGWLY